MADENLPIAQKSHVPIVDGVLAPKDFDGLWRCISVICETSMAGSYRKKPEEAFVAAQLGMSVGMNYMQALQSVAVIKGKPSLYGDATTALCKASNQMEDHQEYWELDGDKLQDYEGPEDLKEWPDNLKAVCLMKRRGVTSPQIGKFSIMDAKRMQKWNKHTSDGNLSVWQKHPLDMLMWKARHRAQSTAFADVLKGFLPAAIAADYEATDIEETAPNVYAAKSDPIATPPESAEAPTAEKKKVASDMQFMIDFAQARSLSISRLEEFCNKIAKENSTTLSGLIPDIIKREAEFVSMFKAWDVSESGGGYVGDPDPDEGPIPDGTEDSLDELVDDKETSKPVSATAMVMLSLAEEEAMLRIKLDKALEEYTMKDEAAYIDSDTDENMSEYLDYCAEMTKRPMLEILKLAEKSPDNYCKYFFSWLATKEPEEAGSPAEEAPNGTYANAEEEAADTEIHAPALENPEIPPTVAKEMTVPDVIANAARKSALSKFVLSFKNMPAARFESWVMENEKDLKAAHPLDFKEAVRKWESMVAQGKIAGEWPYRQVQGNLELTDPGVANFRQRVANLKKTNPSEAEDARKKLGFGSTVSEEAAKIWEAKIHELIEAKAKKAMRKKR